MAEPQRQWRAKKITLVGLDETILSSQPTPEATHGMPLEYNLTDVPKVPEEIARPSPPINE